MNSKQQRQRPQAERLLIVTHPDGFMEVFADKLVQVHHATMLAAPPAGELVAEQILEEDLPRPYRDLYWPGNRRYCGMVERRTAADEFARMEDVATFDARAALLGNQCQDFDEEEDEREIDSANIVRPELIIHPMVMAIAIPMMEDRGGKPRGQFALYVQHADGTRERRILRSRLDLRDKRRLWIHPEPAEPTASMKANWSRPSRLRWEKGEPAPNPSVLFAEMLEQISAYLELPEDTGPGTLATLACWTLLTYIYPAWPAVPYLFIGGPLGSGKSRTFEILARLVFRPLSTSNLTGASLFRTLHDKGGTLLLDEAERLKQTSQPDVGELLSMLLAGYKKGGQATRLEATKNGLFKTVAFDVFGPKAMACIAGLPPALMSRCIPVTMFRASPDSEKPRRRFDDHPERWQSLRDALHRLTLGYGPTWIDLAADMDCCPRMGGRDFELWQPLLAIAKWLDDQGCRGLHGLMVEHAKSVIMAAKVDSVPDADIVLLTVLAAAHRDGRRLTPSELLEEAKRHEEPLFRQWWPRGVTSRLKLYGIPAPKKVMSRREFRDVTTGMLTRIQEHYGLDLEME